MSLNSFTTELKELWTTKYLREDIYAGFSVAIVSIPLALAIGMASEVPHTLALTTAVVGGIVAAIFGSSRLSITGPALSMAVLTANCVEKHGLASLVIIGVICGLLQVLVGILKLGRFSKLIPLPIVHAFTSGVGAILLLEALPIMLQIHTHDVYHPLDVIKNLIIYINHMNPLAFILALITIFIARKLPKYLPKFPALLIAVLIPTLIVWIFNLKQIQLVGALPHQLTIPELPNFATINSWHSLLISAMAIFVLASLETILSVRSIDKLGLGDLHNPNRELIGQGLANISSALLGAIPATALLTRSKINIESGAKTKRAAIFQSLIILIVIYAFPQILENIPLTVLAGVLFSAALSMLNHQQAVTYWKQDKSEFLIFSITFIMLVFTNLIDGIQTGIMVALFIMVMRMLATKSNIRLWNNQQVIRISLSGNITFLSFEKLSELKKQISKHAQLHFVIFEFEKLQSIDSAGCQHLLDMIEEINLTGLKVIIHGLTRDQYKLLKSLNVDDIPFVNTVTESEIKQILETGGVSYTANEILKQGLEKFQEQYAKERSKLINTLAKEQQPHTLLITCSDSRLNPNEFFASGLGEIFMVRNVGNVVPCYSQNIKYSEAAAIEYAICHLNIRNIIICAHTECGAIKASIKHADSHDASGLDNWLQIIKEGFKKHAPSDPTEGTKLNLLNQIEHLKTYPLVEDLLAKNEITISAWVYDVHSAQILEWDTSQQDFRYILAQSNDSN